VRVADAVFDKPPLPPLSKAVTVTVLFFEPALVPFTLTEKVHEAPIASVALEREMVPVPAVAVMLPPPHDPVRPLGVETATPDGKVSVKAMPVSVDTLVAGLVIVKASVLVPLRAIEEGVKDLVMVGGNEPTISVAVALLPTPPSTDVTGPVVFVN
jgi:hypothetical protein